jgi:hypothetical protein
VSVCPACLEAMGDAEEGLEGLEGLDLEDFVLSEKACIKA